MNFFFFLISAKLKTQVFFHGSNQRALHASEPPHSYHRSRGDYRLSIFTRHRTEHPHTISKKGTYKECWLPGTAQVDVGTRAGVLQGNGLGSLWQEAVGKGFLRVNQVQAWDRGLGAEHDSVGGIMKKKAIG